MKLNGPDKYHLTITDQSASVRSPDGTTHFVAPATVSGKSKIYVVTKASILLYVGVKNQPMSARLRGGLIADGTHGYHGYKWRRENHDIHLNIWYLEGDDIKSTDLETIEAEVVFLSEGIRPLAPSTNRDSLSPVR